MKARAWGTLLLAAALSAVLACDDGGRSAALAELSAEAIEARTSFLADDLLGGRGPGSFGAELAARYIAVQFEQAGLAPGVGDSSYLQTVPLLEIESDLRLSLRAPGGASLEPEPGGELIAWSPRDSEILDLRGELVFAGYGTVAAEEDWDDYQGADVRGAILLVLSGEPGRGGDAGFQGDTLSHYGLPEYKYGEAATRGAAGVLLIHTAGHPESWEAIRRFRTERQLRQAGDRSNRELALEGWLSGEAAAQIVAMAGLDFETMIEAAEAPGFRPIATELSVSVTGRNRVRHRVGRNVAGLLPGRRSPPSFLVFLARYGGEGYGPPVESDSIYNGCYRNASGASLLISLAEAFARLREPPQRSLLFLAVTADPSRPLGASHYVRHPTVPLARTVAAINIDGANLWGRTADAVVLGTAESDLDALVHEAVEAEGLSRAADPLPHLGRLYRSDHVPFMRAGVPVALVQHGVDYIGRMPGWGQRVLDDYHRRVVGTPEDECTADLEYGGAVQQARLAFRLGHAVANLEPPPRRHAGAEHRSAQDSLLAGEGRR